MPLNTTNPISFSTKATVFGKFRRNDICDKESNESIYTFIAWLVKFLRRSSSCDTLFGLGTTTIKALLLKKDTFLSYAKKNLKKPFLLSCTAVHLQEVALFYQISKFELFLSSPLQFWITYSIIETPKTVNNVQAESVKKISKKI